MQVGRQRYRPRQHLLSEEETLAVLQAYQRRHPWGLRELMRLMGYAYDGTPEGLHAISQVVRGIAFRP